MDIGSIFLILGLFILVGLYVSRPFFEKSNASEIRAGHQQSALLAERDSILNSLQELDLDQAMGKIPEADYQAQRAVLVQEGAQVLRDLDALSPSASSQDAEAHMEAALAARRLETARTAGVPNGAGGKNMIAHADDDLEVIIANRRRERSEKAAGFCPQCGNAVQKSDRFCPKCGVTLSGIPT